MSETREPRVYLAGPDVFRADAVAVGELKKALCARFGFDGVFPMDTLPGAQPRDEDDPRSIYNACVAHMDRCDALVADMTPFHGPSMDVGTAFEMCYVAARGLPVFGYSEVLGAYYDRVSPGRVTTKNSQQRDADGLLIEPFGLQDNLMVVIGCTDDTVHPSLEAALKALAAHLDDDRTRSRGRE